MYWCSSFYFQLNLQINDILSSLTLNGINVIIIRSKVSPYFNNRGDQADTKANDASHFVVCLLLLYVQLDNETVSHCY